MVFHYADEDKEKHESVVIAGCMVGFLVTQGLVLFIIGNHHRNVRAKGARHLNNVLCVFISLTIERSHLQVFETYVISAILNGTRVEYPSVKYGVMSCLMKLPVFMFWFLATGRLSYFFRNSERDLALVLLLCSSLMAFTAMDMFACLQYDAAISVARAWFSMFWHWFIVFVAILLLRVVVWLEFFAAMRRLTMSQYSKQQRAEIPQVSPANGSQDGIELANVSPSTPLTSHHPEIASEAEPPQDLSGSLAQEDVEKPVRTLSRHVTIAADLPDEHQHAIRGGSCTSWESFSSSAPRDTRGYARSLQIQNTFSSFEIRSSRAVGRLKTLGSAQKLCAMMKQQERRQVADESLSVGTQSIATVSWRWPSRNRRASQIPQSVGHLHDATRDWINEVREVEHECSAIALGYLIKEAVKSQILDRSSKIGQFKACRSVHVTWMCLASLISIAVQMLLRGGTPYLERVISRSEIEHLQALMSASSGWLCVTVIRMWLSLHVSHSLNLYIFLAFVSTTLLACLLLASSKMQSLGICTSDIAEDLMSSLGMVTGFVWQVTWAAGVHSILQDGLPGKIGHGQTVVELIISLVVAGVLIPGWRFYVLPSALEAEEHSGDGLESTSVFPSSSALSTRTGGRELREESGDEASPASPPESTNAESHSVIRSDNAAKFSW